MMKTRPPLLARTGVLAAAVALAVAGCASGAVRTAPPHQSPTGTPPTVASAAPSVVPSVGVPSVAPSPAASVAASTAAPVTPVPSAVPAPSVTPAPRPFGTPPPLPTAPPRESVAPSAVASVVVGPTERPGPTPIVGEVKPAPEFVDLVKADGTPFTLADDRGHTTLVFFGYTHCPDVCPATIGELMQVLQARPDVRVVFVTVDPERDTPEFLAEWTKYLPEGLVAVTGSPLAIRHAADSYGVRYARVDTDSRNGYSMSHTAFQYVIDGDGNLVMTYPFGTPAAAIIGDLDTLDRAG